MQRLVCLMIPWLDRVFENWIKAGNANKYIAIIIHALWFIFALLLIRYSSVSRYICPPTSLSEKEAFDTLNDIDANIDDEVFKTAISSGLDPALAAHLGHMFVRDPLVIFDDSIYLNDDRSLVSKITNCSQLFVTRWIQEHFENIQSTNWRTMRWKPPSLELGLEAQRVSAAG